MNVRDDVDIKAQFAERGSSGGAFPATIKVTILTERDGRPLSDLWVRANSALDGVTKSARYPFSSATTPTSRTLPPGLLTIWVESTDHGRVLAEEQILLGEGGSDQEPPIKIPIP